MTLIILLLINFLNHTYFLDFSIIGAIIIAIGLYCVVWGKAKDNSNTTPVSPTTMKQIETQHLPITASGHV